ncbi:MAG: SusD/RagB family nutrient-binding outer membrane lipoprotein [Hymenobacter sp.]|nr:MAG: SusD/RagB family nutrient-binding outer membrane lipoprotein [Hymenobacter sp.]
MKILFKVLAAAALSTTASSCSSFLDINNNPNSFATATPDAILATALNTYDNLNDYQLIQNQGSTYPNHAAIARIMKVYNYLLLVDEYGDIPYTNALQGATNTTPSYDSAPTIYRDFITQLNGAISDINAAAANGRAVGGEDVVFGGNMTNWKRFANSLKLRILLRESSTTNADLNTYVTTQMAALQNPTDGFITADVVVQPGYAQNTAQQNPFYNRYGYTIASTSAPERQYQIPTQFILNQYVNNNDPRLTQLYVIGARGGTSATGPQVQEWIGAVPGEQSSPQFVAPIIGSRFLGSNTSTPGTGGFFKGLNAPTILMPVSEHLFSKAEAESRGLLPGGDAAAKTDFQSGTAAAFQTNYRTATGTLAAVPTDLMATSTAAGISQYQAYVAANTTNGLVNWDAATTTLSTQGTPTSSARTVSKLEKIIYQKYLAMNILNSIEAWDDYRRTAYPKIPASLQTVISNRADRLPTRLLYPLTESSTNKSNVPTNATSTTKIFWDEID